MIHRRWAWMTTLSAAFGLVGCGIAPKSFKKVNDPAPIVRARSIGLADSLPRGHAVPALLNRLEDSDPVVRLAAFEELKKGTGRSFGYVPWGGDADRAEAVARWRAWWNAQQGPLARSGNIP